MSTNKRGMDFLQDPSLNKSTAFSEAEKQTLGIVGLLPDITETDYADLRGAVGKPCDQRVDILAILFQARLRFLTSDPQFEHHQSDRHVLP